MKNHEIHLRIIRLLKCGFLILENGHIEISTKMAFYFEQTFGMHHEYFIDIVNEFVFKGTVNGINI